MGTSNAYGGSSGAAWEAVREAWAGLGDGVDVPAQDTPSDSPPVPPEYDDLGQALGQALMPPVRPGPAPSLPSLLPRSRGSGGGGGGGTGGGETGGYAGQVGGRTRRSVALQAARGGAAVGAAHAYRARDAAALSQYGITLAELDALSPRMRCAKILDLVLGDAGHPDEAAVRKASAQQVKKIIDPTQPDQTTVESLRDMIGEITLQLGLVELTDQILANTTTPAAATKKENGLRSWIKAKVRGLDLGKYGTVSSTDCHRAAHALWVDAQRLIGGK